MKLRSLLLLAAIVASITSSAIEKHYTRSVDKPRGMNIIRAIEPNGYIMAGTSNILNSSGGTNRCIVVKKIDAAGNIVWSNTYSILTDMDHECLRVNISIQRDKYVITGFVVIGGTPASPKFRPYVMALAPNGAILWTRLFDDSGVFFDIEPTTDNGFVISGYYGDRLDENSSYMDAVVLKVDATASTIVWQKFIKSFKTDPSLTTQWDVAESITPVRIPGQTDKYFISGSVSKDMTIGGLPERKKSVMALMIDDNGNLVWNASFMSIPGEGMPCSEVGADAAFDPVTQKIYLISNTSHTCAYSGLVCFLTMLNVTSGAMMMKWHIEGDPSTSPGAHLIHLSKIFFNQSQRRLKIYGYTGDQLRLPDGTIHSDYYVPFELMLDPLNVSTRWFKLFFTANPGYSSVYTDWLGTQYTGTGAGSHCPLIYTPDMALPTSIGGPGLANYAVIGHGVQVSGIYHNALFTPDGIQPCEVYERDVHIVQSLVHSTVDIEHINITETFVSPMASQAAYTYNIADCPGPYFKTTGVGEATATTAANVYPIPANEHIRVSIPGGVSGISIALLSLQGSVIKEITGIPAGDESVDMDVADVSTGVYQLNVRYGDKTETHKVSIIR